MQTHTEENTASQPWTTVHALTPKDADVMTGVRAATAPVKGLLQGTAARQPFDDMMGHVPAPEGVTFEEDMVGGVPGWWCRPADARSGEAILHIHGGWFVLGSAQAYRNFAGQIAARAGVAAFVPDYRLAPEHPYPAATLDVQSVYDGLVERGIRRIAIVGDSAGGCLALLLLAARASGGVVPVGAVALSPVTDLALTGETYETRAEADPYFTRSQAEGMVPLYLNGHAPKDPLVSPLYGDLAGLPPVRVHVGDAELLLDDSRRYVERAAAAGVDARIDVWLGMPHVFPSSVGQLDAADEALTAIGAFLTERLTATN